MKLIEQNELRSDVRRLTRVLRRMPVAVPPSSLSTSLQVLASRERKRAASKRTWRDRGADLWDRARLVGENLMRPLAVPVMGGVFSAILLFSSWVAPTYPAGARAAILAGDIPTVLTTDASVKGTMPLVAPARDIIVDVLVNEKGRMVEYSVVSGAYMLTAISRRQLENRLVFTEFVPATAFGKPMRGRTRVWFSTASIEVKG